MGFRNPGQVAHQLHAKMTDAVTEILPFTSSSNEEIRTFAAQILDALGQSAA